jgi:formylglycine-generating enzyme required for sulfatase activity
LLRHAREGPAARLLDWGKAKELDAIDRELAGKPPRKKPDAPAREHKPAAREKRACDGSGWYVNSQGQTMVRIEGPVEFRMGSPLWEPDRIPVNEQPHLRRIERSFAVASTPVTVAQWERFLKDRPEVPKDYLTRYSPEPGGPIIQVSWYAAVEYCNWLSEQEQEKLPLCYPRENRAGMRIDPDLLARGGYRLPTEAELEYVGRAGAGESRYFGSPVELLPRYENYQANSANRTWPVGQKRPNDLGLFDVQGNVWNWCQDQARFYPRRNSAQNSLDILRGSYIIDDNRGRILRGGSFLYHAPDVRASLRDSFRPGLRSSSVGLRVCRTYD